MDAALKLIMGQFKELKSEISTTTAKLKMDVCIWYQTGGTEE